MKKPAAFSILWLLGDAAVNLNLACACAREQQQVQYFVSNHSVNWRQRSNPLGRICAVEKRRRATKALSRMLQALVLLRTPGAPLS